VKETEGERAIRRIRDWPRKQCGVRRKFENADQRREFMRLVGRLFKNYPQSVVNAARDADIERTTLYHWRHEAIATGVMKPEEMAMVSVKSTPLRIANDVENGLGCVEIMAKYRIAHATARKRIIEAVKAGHLSAHQAKLAYLPRKFRVPKPLGTPPADCLLDTVTHNLICCRTGTVVVAPTIIEINTKFDDRLHAMTTEKLRFVPLWYKEQKGNGKPKAKT